MIEDIDCILFDWDGTLADTMPLIKKAHSHVHQHITGKPLTPQEFEDNSKFSSREIYPKLYGDRWEEGIEVLFKYIDDNHLNDLEFMPYANDLLNLLRQNSNIVTGVVSNKVHDYLGKEIKHLETEDIFLHYVGAGHAEKDKPDKAPVSLIYQYMGFNPEGKSILYVGDKDTDVKTAINSNCIPVLIAKEAYRKKIATEYKLQYHFENLDDFTKSLGLQ